MFNVVILNMREYRKYLARILVFLTLIITFIFFNFSKLQTGFFHNPELNSVIGIIFLAGIFFSVRSIFLLKSDHILINEIMSNNTTSFSSKPKIVMDFYNSIKDKTYDFNKASQQKYLEKISFKLEADREINKYLIAVLVFLGLLGTFWGLLSTVDSVGKTISNLSVEEKDIFSTFLALKEGLKNPMAGMGTAFSSSLFGLSGSLCLGFIDLQLSGAQNDFLDNLDNKLENNSKVKENYEVDSSPVYLEALLNQTVEGLNKMTELFEKNENSKKNLEDVIVKSINVLSKVNDEIDFRLNQSEQTAISNLEHIRNIDNSLTSIKDNLKTDQEAMTTELSKEIKILAKTISLINK